MFESFWLTRNDDTPIWMQIDATCFIIPRNRAVSAGELDFHTDLLFDLTDQGSFRCLSIFDFAAREFPKTSKMPRIVTLARKNSSISTNNYSAYDIHHVVSIHATSTQAIANWVNWT